MSETLYLLTIGLPMATLILIFGMRYAALGRQAQARLDGEVAYRRIAEKAAQAESETANGLATLQVAVADVRDRLAGIEKILKDVG